MLILVPTAVEADILAAEGLPGTPVVCGFGLAAAGAGAAHAIATHRDAAGAGVVLIGAAGTYDPDRHPVGSAATAGAVRCDGIGAGTGAGHRSGAELGFADSDLIGLGDGVELLSVAAAAGSRAEAAERRRRHPDAAGEEMEGYAVALAARLFGADLMVVRGFSNAAGERRPSRWRMHEALAAAAGLVAGAVR
jgi:futalosine hydrolase